MWLKRQFAQHALGGREATRWIRSQNRTPTHVFVYGGGTGYAVRVLSTARAVGAVSVADVVEWYSPRQFSGSVVAPAWLSAQAALRWVYPRFNAVIAISTFLRDRYPRVRVREVVPPTLHVNRQESDRAAAAGTGGAASVRLCYFGTPGKKDLLGQIIEGFARARDELRPGIELSLTVVGPTTEEVASLLDDSVPAGVTIMGRVSQMAVADVVQRCDFSILLRPEARYSRAGFPTKFVESLATGTPVISNLTSDLSAFLQDGVNGFVVAGSTGADLAECLLRASRLTLDQRLAMRGAARATALRHFDVNVTTPLLARLMLGETDG